MKMNRIKGKHVKSIRCYCLYRQNRQELLFVIQHSMLADLNVAKNLRLYALAGIFIVQKGTHLE